MIGTSLAWCVEGGAWRASCAGQVARRPSSASAGATVPAAATAAPCQQRWLGHGLAAGLLALVTSVALAALFALPTPAAAHQASDAYLRAGTGADGRLTLQIDVALRDLDVVLELDADSDGRLTWGEVRRREQDIAAHVAAHLRLDGGRCALTPRAGLALDRKADGVYAVLHFDAACTAASRPALAYGLFRESDPTHRGLLLVGGAPGQGDGALRSLAPGGAPVRLAPPGSDAAGGGGAGLSGTAATAGAPATSATQPIQPAQPTQNESPDAVLDASPSAPPSALGGFFGDGLHHILIGADHVLFLVCLLLPLVLAGDAAAGGWRRRAWPLAALVTAFTVGHSITLALASLRLLNVPPSVIEPLIAATIALTALDNLVPVLGRKRVAAAFAFGLIHGFGFAGPLLELDLAPLAMAWALLQFNLGVEAGQLLVVVVAAVLLWPLRGRPAARTLLRAGSAAAGLVALVWLAERLAGFKVLPF